jgi:hypothetical protein
MNMTGSPMITPDCEKQNIQALVYAVIVHAAQDANKGNDDAAQWIREEGIYWIDGAFDVYIPPERVAAWIARGCPLPRSLQLVAPKRTPARKAAKPTRTRKPSQIAAYA